MKLFYQRFAVLRIYQAYQCPYTLPQPSLTSETNKQEDYSDLIRSFRPPALEILADAADRIKDYLQSLLGVGHGESPRRLNRISARLSCSAADAL